MSSNSALEGREQKRGMERGFPRTKEEEEEEMLCLVKVQQTREGK